MATINDLILNLPAEKKAHLLRIGRLYSSTDTLAQANHTLQAYTTHREVLSEYGFGEEDGGRLTMTRDELKVAISERDKVGTGKKQTNTGYTSALKEAKAKRLQAKSLLKNLGGVLALRGDKESQAAREKLEVTATKIERSTGTNAEALALQLDAVVALFTDQSIEAVAKGRGGKTLLNGLDKIIQTLRDSYEVRDIRPGTPAHTERLDLLDGLIVEACRAARTAARAADEALGQSALAKELRLQFLEPAHGTTPEDKKA
jgi:hypothetical protein